ncbi:Cytochrome P450 [Macrophomina phaseolina MS6]|uniref:Cytochrome P450 n=1 Tax=Macrophomina phaseolina (strain MS6) TaxID=1126212 RepID=K2S4V5_MACPH|nr:Cytochrome P450 [Macrophomina phaseolina MS6]
MYASNSIPRPDFNLAGPDPGPKYAIASGLVYWYISIAGDIPYWVHRMHETYGETVRLGPDRLSFIHPQAWKDIYGHRVGAASKKAISKDPRKYPPEYDGSYNMATMVDDHAHARARKIFTNAFSDRALREQEPMIRSYTAHFIRNLYEVKGETDLVTQLNCTTFDIMGDLTFGESLGLLSNSELSPWVKAIFENLKVGELLSIGHDYPILGALMYAVLPKSLRDQQRRHFEHSAERVDRRIAKGDTAKPDIWKLALSKGKDVLDKGTMYAHSSAFMIAGSETTATAVSGATYFLLKNPDKMRKLTEEVRSLESEEDLTLDALQHMKYLSACLEEALRMYPPVPIGLARIVTEGGSAVCGEWIPPKTRVSVPQYAAYYSPRNFKDPESFIPERWLPDTGFDSDRKDALQPFSTGPRNCLGKNLAYHEMRILLAKLLWHFDLELSPKCQNWNEQKNYALWEKHPLYVTLKPIRQK